MFMQQTYPSSEGSVWTNYFLTPKRNLGKPQYRLRIPGKVRYGQLRSPGGNPSLSPHRDRSQRRCHTHYKYFHQQKRSMGPEGAYPLKAGLESYWLWRQPVKPYPRYLSDSDRNRPGRFPWSSFQRDKV